MHVRNLGLAIAALSALCPTISNAWPGKTSLDACVNAFEKSLAEPGAAAHAYKLVYGGDRFESSVAQYFPMGYVYDLQANNPKTGMIFARARCAADGRGIVSSLSPLPLAAAEAAQLAAQ